MLERRADGAVRSLAVSPVGDDLPGGGTVRVCGDREGHTEVREVREVREGMRAD